MPLIASVVSGSDFYHLSDLLVTRDRPEKVTASIRSPLLSPSPRSLNYFSQEYFLRKSILEDGKFLVSFSGNVVLGFGGMKVIKNVKQEIVSDFSLDPALRVFQEHLAGYKKPDVSFIVALAKIDGTKMRLLNRCIGCSEIIDGDLTMKVSGSGASLFVEPNLISSFESVHRLEMEGESSAAEFTWTRLAQLFVAVLTDSSFDYFRFGGWYEVFGVGRNGLSRVSYAVSIFDSSEKLLNPRKYVRAIEFEGQMFVVDMTKNSLDLSNVNLGLYFVKDYVQGRTSGLSPDKIQIIAIRALIEEPEMTILLIPFGNEGHVYVQVLGKAPFSFVDNGGIQMIQNADVVERILSDIDMTL